MQDPRYNEQSRCKRGAEELRRFLARSCYRRMVRITDDQVGVIRRLARRVRRGERPASAAAVQARRELHDYFTATQQERIAHLKEFGESLAETPTLPTVRDVLDSLGLRDDEKVEGCTRDWLDALVRDFPPPRPSHIDGKRVVYGFVSSGLGRGSTYEAGRYCIYWCGHRWWIHDAEEGTIRVRCRFCTLADDPEPGLVHPLDAGNAYLVPVRDDEAWSHALSASKQRLNRWAEDLPDDRFPAGAFLAWKLEQEQVAARGLVAPEAGAPTISGTSAWPPTV